MRSLYRASPLIFLSSLDLHKILKQFNGNHCAPANKGETLFDLSSSSQFNWKQLEARAGELWMVSKGPCRANGKVFLEL